MISMLASLLVSLGLYSISTIVVDVDYDTDIVTCEDFNGNQWQFSECDDWFENDIAVLTFYDNGTKIIYDDVIVAKRYSGYVK